MKKSVEKGTKLMVADFTKFIKERERVITTPNYGVRRFCDIEPIVVIGKVKDTLDGRMVLVRFSSAPNNHSYTEFVHVESIKTNNYERR